MGSQSRVEMGGAVGTGAAGAFALMMDGPDAAALDDLEDVLGVRPVPQTLAEFAARRPWRGGHHPSHVVIVGHSPKSTIGYGLASLVAAAARPISVVAYDPLVRGASSAGVLRHGLRSSPFVLAQGVMSLGAIGAQRAIAELLRRRPPVMRRGHNPRLRRVLYLKTAVGRAVGAGGSITHTHEVIRALLALGISVSPMTTDSAIAETARQEMMIPFTWRTTRPAPSTLGLPASAGLGEDIALLRSALPVARDSDVVYQRHCRFSMIGALVSQLTNRPLFLEFNNSELFFASTWHRTPLQSQLRLCEEAALAAAARIIVVSDIAREELLERGVPADRIVVNPNGVDADRFAVGGGREIREGYGIASEDFVVGFVGSFGPWHGVPTLVAAFADIAERVPHARLLLVGDGDEADSARRVAANARVLDRVTFAGRVAPGDIPAHLDACDVLVSPHVPLPNDVAFFGSPTKLFEYMAAERPIVASRLGQIADVLQDGHTALLVTPGSIAELADSVVRLAEAPNLRTALAHAARRDAIRNHSWTSNARRVAAAYQDLLPKL